MSARLVRTVGILAALLHPALAPGVQAGDRPLGEIAMRDAAAALPVTAALLGAEARFETASDVLSEAGGAALERLLSRLERHGEPLSIQVVGHTDSRGPSDYNLRLSERRAAHVAAVLARTYPAVPLLSAGAGESAPRASEATAGGRERNRRVEIRIVVAAGRRR